MNKGLLTNTDKRWYINELPIHEQHSFWLTMFGEVGKEMTYVIENGRAILKADKPDTHEYIQD